MGLLGPFDIAQARDRVFRSVWQRLPDHDQPAWIAIGQRVHNHCIEDAEHRSVRADAKGERQDGGDTKTWLLRKRTQGVTKSGHFLNTLRPKEWGRGTQECVRHNR